MLDAVLRRALDRCEESLVRFVGLAFSPNGRQLAVGTVWRDVLLIDLEAETCSLKFRASEGSNSALAFSPDGGLLAVGSTHNSCVALHDVETGAVAQVLQGRRNNLRCLAWSRSGVLAVGGCDGFIELWREGLRMGMLAMQTGDR